MKLEETILYESESESRLLLNDKEATYRQWRLLGRVKGSNTEGYDTKYDIRAECDHDKITGNTRCVDHMGRTRPDFHSKSGIMYRCSGKKPWKAKEETSTKYSLVQ